ncbi:hypothetical protein VMA_002932 [Vibrio mimicus VM223]|nr:hypothetical protein VMA_002932 [Vibrio mimicus VM223]
MILRNITRGQNGVKFHLFLANGRNHRRKTVSRIHTQQATIFGRKQMRIRDLN